MTGGRAGASGRLRIIGGAWRGRKLRFRAAPGLRPTPDSVRETLFNWLAASVRDSRCLDLFAGSGALGLEALSRGAAHCTFVDDSRSGVEAIREQLAALRCDDGEAVRADAPRHLRGNPPAAPYDLVFLDPPFGRGLLPGVCRTMEAGGWLARGAHIYMESGAGEPDPALPANWREKRDKRAGGVRYRLFVREE